MLFQQSNTSLALVNTQKGIFKLHSNIVWRSVIEQAESAWKRKTERARREGMQWAVSEKWKQSWKWMKDHRYVSQLKRFLAISAGSFF